VAAQRRLQQRASAAALRVCRGSTQPADRLPVLLLLLLLLLAPDTRRTAPAAQGL
jgi:hypothetical protein